MRGRNFKGGRGGFTLLELIMVIAIIALLSGIAIGAGRHAIEAAKVARAKAELAALSVALDAYRRQHGDYPLTDDPVQMLDPWGQAYRYAYKTQSPWTNSSYVLWSPGPDGTESAALLAGGYADRSASPNLDNIYANQY